MGDMADYYTDQDMEAEFERDMFDIDQHDESLRIKRLYKKGKLTWEQRDEDKINVWDMTDRHIVNTKLFLENKAIDSPIQKMWIKVFKKEIKKRSKQKTK